MLTDVRDGGAREAPSESGEGGAAAERAAPLSEPEPEPELELEEGTPPVGAGPLLAPVPPGLRSSSIRGRSTSDIPTAVSCRVIEGRALKGMDWTGKSDPYVEVRVRSIGGKAIKSEKNTTTVVEQTKDPSWNAVRCSPSFSSPSAPPDWAC